MNFLHIFFHPAFAFDIKIEVYKRDSNKELVLVPELTKTGKADLTQNDSGAINDTQIRISTPDLRPYVIENVKGSPFLLKVTATDKDGNKTVKTLSFYVK